MSHLAYSCHVARLAMWLEEPRTILQRPSRLRAWLCPGRFRSSRDARRGSGGLLLFRGARFLLVNPYRRSTSDVRRGLQTGTYAVVQDKTAPHHAVLLVLDGSTLIRKVRTPIL